MALTQVKTGGINADSVTAAKIADDAVGAEHIEQLDADLSFADNVHAKFGAGNDLQIDHSGTNSQIYHDGTGHLYIATQGSGEDLIIQAKNEFKVSTGDAERLRVTSGGSVNIGSTGGFDSNGDDLTITNSSHGGISIKTGTTSDGVLRFGDGSGADEYRGYINYRHDGDKFLIGTSGTQRLSIDSDGLKFGSDTAAANALDDYEEGTWTPAWSDASSGGTAATVNQAHGRYTKIGRVVHLHFYTWSIQNQGTSNSMYLQGLPFAAIGGFSFIGSVGGRYWNQGDDNQYNLQVRVNANNSYGNLEWAESHSGDGVAATFDGIVNAYTNFTCTLTYLTDS